MKQSVASLALATIVLAGCGSSSSPASTTDEDTGRHADSGAGFDAATDTSTPPVDGASDSTSSIDSAVAETAPDGGVDSTTSIDTSAPDTRPADTGAVDSARPDTGVVPVDTGFDSAGPDHGGTTGAACVDDSTCDVTGDGVNVCSNAIFTLGTLYPAPVCIGKDCDPGDGTTIMSCDGTAGVCLSTGSGGICLPACAFDDSGAAPTGCAGKDVCNVYGWGKDASGALSGVGYCFGGCVADTDCTGGDVCQKESGLCVKTRVTYTKTLGTACTSADATASPVRCECLYLTSTLKGYCSTFCKVGDATSACPTGYQCSPGLPTTDATDGSALFSTDPSGIAANCLKTCTVDSDCTPLNSTCKDTATGKVCYPN